MLDGLISLILSVESEFEPYLPNCVDPVLTCMESSDWNTRKAAIDTAYTFGMVIPEAAKRFAAEFYRILNNLRSDKIKPVREVAVEAA
jgi:hypothetical protein